MNHSQQDICKEQVYNKVFYTYAKDLKMHLYFKYKDMASAEDILQDTFIKLWNNCSKVTLEKVKSYLYTVANNAFLDVKKHENVVRKHQKGFVNYNETESPEFLMIEEEFLQKVERVIASLPEKQREVFVMSRIEKLKYKEISDKLGISVKAIEKRMRNALIVIRKEIGNI